MSGDYAYVADYYYGLRIVDVSNKSAPVLAGSYDTVGSVYGVAVSGDNVYVADGGNGVILRTDVSGAADTTPPHLTIIAPAPDTTTHTTTITIAGTASDASGIESVTVNGEPANGTLNWSANVTLLEGENTIIVIATDGAGLNTTKMITVWLEPPRGDLNDDYVLTPADAAIALVLAAGGGSASCDAATLAAADVSGDGQVTSLDALMILQTATSTIEL